MNQNQIPRRQTSLLHINGKDACYWFLLIFLTLPHMKPAYLARIPTVDMVFDILRGVSFLVIVLWHVIGRKSVSLVIALVAVWRVFLVSSTLVHGGEVYACIVESFSIMSVVLLYDAAYNSEKPIFISAQLFCFELMIYINLLTEVIFPSGLYTTVSTIVHNENWFIGYYNNHSQFFIPALMFAWLYREKTGKTMRTILLTMAIYISAVLVWSGGVLLSLAGMTLIFLFLKKQTRLLNYYTYWLLHIVFFVSVYVLHVQDWFHWLLVDILGKMGSLTFRITLWGRVLKLIAESPILGHGSQDVFVRTAEVHLAHGVHAHNMLLEQLYLGGVTGLTLWVCIILLSGRQLMKYSDTKESKIISTAFLGWCIATLVEPFTTPFLMGMFVIAYRSNQEEAIVQNSTAEGPYQERTSRKYRIRMRRR